MGKTAKGHGDKSVSAVMIAVFIAVASIIVLVVAISMSGRVKVANDKEKLYNQIISEWDDEKYEDAWYDVLKFRDLYNDADSYEEFAEYEAKVERYPEYREAMQLYNAGEYVQAAGAFGELGDAFNAHDMMIESVTKLGQAIVEGNWKG